MKKKISITMNERTLKEVDSMVNGISIRNRSQAIEFLVNKSLGDNKPAVILAGGGDKHLKINGTLKPTLKINGTSIIELSVQKLRESGFKDIFIVARRPILTKIFKIIGNGESYGVNVNFVEEKKTKGSAETLKLLRGKIKKTFLVVYCDIIFNEINLKTLWRDHVRQKAITTLLISSSAITRNEVGTVKMEGDKIVEFSEKPEMPESYVFFSGIFVTEPEILSYGGSSLEKDVFPQLVKRGLISGHLSSKKYLHLHENEDLEVVKKHMERISS